MGIRTIGIPLLVVALATAVVQPTASAATASFGPRADYPAGQWPFSVATGDLNGDGRLDMAVGNQLGESVSILLNTGKGGFRPMPEVDIDHWQFIVELADVDGDRRPDLISTNRSDHELSVAINRGGGRFQPARHYDFEGPGGAAGVVAEDFDRDGDVDLAVTHSGMSRIQLLSGNGRGDFTLGGTIDASYGNVSTLSAADLDLDGAVDLVTTRPYMSDVLISLGRGDGTFDPFQEIDVINGTSNAVLDDFTSDGVPDIVVARTSSYSDSAWLLIGNGDGTFGERRTVPVRWADTSTGGDFDGDGRRDLAFAVNATVFVLLGNGDGTFQEQLELAGSADGRAGIPGSADFNGDGKDDLAVPNGTGATGTVWLYLTTASLTGR